MIARTVSVLALAAACAPAGHGFSEPGRPQTVSPGLERANPVMRAGDARAEVRTVVEDFLKELGSRDAAGVRALLAPKVLIAVVRQQRDGAFTTSYQTGDEFLAQLEKSAGQAPFEEPLSNVHVTVDSDRLASVRADFKVVRDGTTLSSGVDHFTLLKESSGWKIAVVAYTSLPAAPAS